MTQTDPRWSQSGWGHRVSSQDELMRAISRIGTLQAGRRFVWRGVANHRYRVRSSLVRDFMDVDGSTVPSERRLRGRELAILREARHWGVGLEAGSLATDLHLLAHLQHHGVPTRLLDVTTNPMTALWFACQHAAEERDASGALMAFDVTDLPEYPTVDPSGPTAWGALGNPTGWSLRMALALSARDQSSFLVRPILRDARMQAQEGLFISGAVPVTPGPSGVDGLPLAAGRTPGAEALKVLFDASDRKAGRPRSLPFCVLVVPTTVKSRMRPHLEGTYSRSYRTLFPDVAGFARAVGSQGVDLSPPDEVIDAHEDAAQNFPPDDG